MQITTNRQYKTSSHFPTIFAKDARSLNYFIHVHTHIIKVCGVSGNVVKIMKAKILYN